MPIEVVLFEPGSPVEAAGSDSEGSASVKLERMVLVSDVWTDSLVGIPEPVIDALTVAVV